MFIKSAATDTLQGRAIQAINTRWGEDFCKWQCRETIGIPVCKKKYAPFAFRIIRGEDGTPKVMVERILAVGVIRLSEKLSLNSTDAGPVGNPLDSGVCERQKKRPDSKRND